MPYNQQPKQLYETTKQKLRDLNWISNNIKYLQNYILPTSRDEEFFVSRTTIIHEAALNATQEVLKLLLNHTEEINIRDKDGNTPLNLILNRLEQISCELEESRSYNPNLANEYNELENKKNLFLDYGGVAPDKLMAREETKELIWEESKKAFFELKSYEEVKRQLAKEDIQLIIEKYSEGDKELEQIYGNFFILLKSTILNLISGYQALESNVLPTKEITFEASLKSSITNFGAGLIVDLLENYSYNKRIKFAKELSIKLRSFQHYNSEDVETIVEDYCARVLEFLRAEVLEYIINEQNLLKQFQFKLQEAKEKVSNKIKEFKDKYIEDENESNELKGYKQHWEFLVSKYTTNFIKFIHSANISDTNERIGVKAANEVIPLRNKKFEIPVGANTNVNKLKQLMVLIRALEESKLTNELLLKEWGYGENSFFIESANARINLINSLDENTVIIALAGNTSIKNKIKSLDISTKEVQFSPLGKLKLYGNLYNITKEVWNEEIKFQEETFQGLREFLAREEISLQGKKIILTGYGIGGAIANILSLYLVESGINSDNLESFALGAPKWLAAGDKMKVDSLLPNLYHIQDYKDPKVAWPLGGKYIHVGNKFYLYNHELISETQFNKLLNQKDSEGSEAKNKENIFNKAFHSLEGVNEYFWEIEGIEKIKEDEKQEDNVSEKTKSSQQNIDYSTLPTSITIRKLTKILEQDNLEELKNAVDSRNIRYRFSEIDTGLWVPLIIYCFREKVKCLKILWAGLPGEERKKIKDLKLILAFITKDNELVRQVVNQYQTYRENTYLLKSEYLTEWEDDTSKVENEKIIEFINQLPELYLTKFELCHLAVSLKCPGLLKEFVDEEIANTESNNLEGTLLHLAIRSGSKNNVKYLLQSGADVEKIGYLTYQNDKGGLQMNAYKKYQPELTSVNQESSTPLCLAAYYNDSEITKELVKYEAIINKVDSLENSALHYAARNGSFEIVKFLIENGAEVNLEGPGEETPLFSAMRSGDWQTINYLVEKGAIIDKVNKGSVTPIWVAAKNGYLEAMKLLREKGALIDRDPGNGVTPLSVAVSNEQTQIVRFLCSKGADVNTEDKNGITPIFDACLQGSLELVKILVEYGANIRKRDNQSPAPPNFLLKNAVAGRFEDYPAKLEVVEFLCENGAKEDISAETLKHSLIHNKGDVEIIKYLIENGADIYKPEESKEKLPSCIPPILDKIGAPDQNISEKIKYIFNYFPEIINLQDSNGREPILICAYRASKLESKARIAGAKVTEFLFEKGAWLYSTDFVQEERKISNQEDNNTQKTSENSLKPPLQKAIEDKDKNFHENGINMLLSVLVANDVKLENIPYIPKDYTTNLLNRAFEGANLSAIIKLIKQGEVPVQEDLEINSKLTANLLLSVSRENLESNTLKQISKQISSIIKNYTGKKEYILVDLDPSYLTFLQQNLLNFTDFELDDEEYEVLTLLAEKRPYFGGKFLLSLLHIQAYKSGIKITEFISKWLTNNISREFKYSSFLEALYYKYFHPNKFLHAITYKQEILQNLIVLEAKIEISTEYESLESLLNEIDELSTNPIFIKRINENPRALENLARAKCLQKLGRVEEAKSYYSQVTKFNQLFPEAYTELGKIYFEKLNASNTEEEYNQVYKQITSCYEELINRNSFICELDKEKYIQFKKTIELELLPNEQSKQFALMDNELENKFSKNIISTPDLDYLKTKLSSELEQYIPRNKAQKKLKTKLQRLMGGLKPGAELLQTYNNTCCLPKQKLLSKTNINETQNCKYFEILYKLMHKIDKRAREVEQQGGEGLKSFLNELREYYNWYLQNFLNEHRVWYNDLFSRNYQLAIKKFNELATRTIPKFPLESVVLYDDNGGKYYLKNEGLINLLVNNATTEVANQYGKHSVIPYEGIHFKYNPHAPGLEFAVNSLSNILTQEATPPVKLIKLTKFSNIEVETDYGEFSNETDDDNNVVKNVCFTEDNERHSKLYQASLSVTGTNLHQVLKENPDWIEELDNSNFTWMFILGILTNPGDAKPDNFMVEYFKNTEGNTKLRIVGVDNDISFCKGLLRLHGESRQGKIYSDILNVLYLLPQMEASIPQEIRFEIKKPFFSEKLIIDWLSHLYTLNKKYEKLKRDDIFSHTELANLKLPIKLPEETAVDIYRKASKLAKMVKNEPYLTPEYIFRQFYPGISVFYKNKRIKHDPLTSILNVYKEAAENEELVNELENVKFSDSEEEVITHLSKASSSRMLSRSEHNEKFNSSIKNEAEIFISKLDFSIFTEEELEIYELLKKLDFVDSLELNNVPSYASEHVKGLIKKIKPRNLKLKNTYLDSKAIEEIKEIHGKAVLFEEETTVKPAYQIKDSEVEKSFWEITSIFEFEKYPQLLEGINFEKLFNLLIKNNLDINEQTQNEETALHKLVYSWLHASSSFQDKLYNFIEILLDCGIDENIVNSEGKTAAEIAEEYNIYPILQLILEHIPTRFWHLVENYQEALTSSNISPNYFAVARREIQYYLTHLSAEKLSRWLEYQEIVGREDSLINVLASNEGNSELLEALLNRNDVGNLKIYNSAEQKNYYTINLLVSNYRDAETPVLDKLLQYKQVLNLGIDTHILTFAYNNNKLQMLACLLNNEGELNLNEIKVNNILDRNEINNLKLAIKASQYGIKLEAIDLIKEYQYQKTNEEGSNILRLAIDKGDIEVLNLLHSQNKEFILNEIESVLNQENDLLYVAAKNKHLLILNKLVSLLRFKNPEFSFYNDKGEHKYALETTQPQIQSGAQASVDFTINQGQISNKELSRIFNSMGFEITLEEALFEVNLEKVNEYGNTVLYELLKSIYTEVLKGTSREELQQQKDLNTLIEAGIDVNYTEREDGFTPLHLAVRFGSDEELITKLKSSNGDPRYFDAYERIPLDIALTEEKLQTEEKGISTRNKIKEYLQQQFSSIQALDYYHNNNNILFDTVVRGKFLQYQWLQQLNPDLVNQKNYMNYTPIELVQNVKSGKYTLDENVEIKELLENNDLINLKQFFKESVFTSDKPLLPLFKQVLLDEIFQDDKKVLFIYYVYLNQPEIFKHSAEELLSTVVIIKEDRCIREIKKCIHLAGGAWDRISSQKFDEFFKKACEYNNLDVAKEIFKYVSSNNKQVFEKVLQKAIELGNEEDSEGINHRLAKAYDLLQVALNYTSSNNEEELIDRNEEKQEELSQNNITSEEYTVTVGLAQIEYDNPMLNEAMKTGDKELLDAALAAETPHYNVLEPISNEEVKLSGEIEKIGEFFDNEIE